MKICPNCGTKSKDKASFCYSCGAKLEETVRPEAKAPEKTAPEKRAASEKIKAVISNKKLLASCAALIVVIVLLIAIIASAASSGNGGYVYPDGETTIIQDGDTVYFVNAKGDVTGIERDGASYNKLCSAGGCLVYSLYKDPDKQALYYYNGKNTVKIADDVNASGAVMSFDGKNVVYTLQSDDKNAAFGYDIYIYSGGKSKKIASDAYLTAVSPDGKTVAYNKDYYTETDSFTGCYYDGKERVIGTNKQIFGISNGGKYVYLSKINSSDTVCYVQKGTKEQTRFKLGNDLTLSSDISSSYFNYDMSKFIYTGNDGGTYITEKGKEPVKIASDALRPLLPKDVFMSSDGSVIGVMSFGDKFFETENYDVVYMNKKNETNTVLSNVSNPFLADDGKTVIYIGKKDLSVEKTDGTKIGAEPVILVEKDASGFLASKDGKTIFYQDTSDGGWYYQKGTSKPKLVTDEQMSRAGIKGKTLYYTSDGMLYASSSGKGKRVGKFADDVSLISVSERLIAVYTADEGRYLVSTNGKSFKLINGDKA